MSNLAFMAPMASFGANLTGAVDKRNVMNQMMKREDDYRAQKLAMEQQELNQKNDQQKAMMQKAFLEQSFKMLELTPDEDLPKWTEHFNKIGSQYGMPQLSSVVRPSRGKSGRGNYQFKELDGKAWSFDSETGQLSPVSDPTSGKQISAQPQWKEPFYDPQGAVWQENTRTGQVQKRASAPKSEKPEKPPKPEMTEKEALDIVAKAESNKARIGKASIADAVIASITGKPVGSEMDEESKQKAIAAEDARIAHAKKFLNRTPPSAGSSSLEQKLAGKPAGVYRTKSGQEIHWDGSKIIGGQ